MREIKFRIPWFAGGIFKKFTNWGYTGEGREFIAPASWPGMKRLDDEQFTGLKDKNGVEIYEGDIVGRLKPGRLKHDKIHLVEWYLPDSSGKWAGFNLRVSDRIEVLGNIHENPDLLK